MSHVAISYEIPNYTAQLVGAGVLNILEAQTSRLKDKINFTTSTSNYGDNNNVPR